jgi:hypothetical protein
MSTELTNRSNLYAVSLQYQEAQLLCASLSVSSTRAFSDSDAAKLHPDSNIQFPIPDPEEKKLSQAFEQAMQIITMPEWGEFVTHSISTVNDEPLQFGKALMEGTYKYIEGEIKALIDLGKSFIDWLGEVASCIQGIKQDIFDLDKVLASDACEPFHDTAFLILKLQDMISELITIGLAGLLEIVVQCLSYVTEIFSEVLFNIMTELGEQATNIKAWLETTAKSAQLLGELIGTLFGTILIELGTSGVGKAIKSTKILNNLPDVDVTPLARSSSNQRDLIHSRIMVRNIKNKKQRELDELAKVFQKILNKNGKKFSRNLTIAKLRVLRKHLGPEHFKKFISNHKALERYISASIKRYTGKVEAYKVLKEEGREFNRRTLAYLYSNHMIGDALPDEFEILTGKYEVLPNIFEANHIIEKRIYKNYKAKWEKEFDLLGWKSEEDMTAVLLTADEHTGSIRAMLRKQMVPEGMPIPEDVQKLLNALDTTLPKSITRILIDEVQVSEKTTFSELLKKYADVYSREAPKVWGNTLHDTFDKWIKILGYDIVLPPKPKF